MKLLWKITMFGLLAYSPAMLKAQSVKANICSEHNRQVKKSLAKDNVLFNPLERNIEGSGITTSWMISLGLLNVKHATAEIYFNVAQDRMYLQLRSVEFYREYYNFGPSSRISTLTSEERSDLTQRLKLPFFASANTILERIDLHKSHCGRLYVSLLDDSCLPVLDEMPQLTTACEDGN